MKKIIYVGALFSMLLLMSMFVSAERLGPELISDTGFDNPGEWNTANFQVSGGYATIPIPPPFPPSTVGQSISAEQGKTYKVQVNITQLTFADLKAQLGGAESGFLSVGTNDFYLTTTNSDTTAQLRSDDIGMLYITVDGFSIREVLPEVDRIKKVKRGDNAVVKMIKWLLNLIGEPVTKIKCEVWVDNS